MFKRSLLALLFVCTTGIAGGPIGIEVAFEELYMLGSMDQPYYIIEGSGELDPTPRIANTQNWHWGYRVEALYDWPNGCDHLKFRWTAFNFSNTDSFTGLSTTILSMPLFSQFNTFGSTKIRDKYALYIAELLLGRLFYQHNALALDLELGIQYINVSFNERVFYGFNSPEAPETPNIIAHYHSTSEGVGPEFCCNFEYVVSPKGFSVLGRVSAALLAQRRSSLEDVARDPTIPGEFVFKTRNTPYWIVNPTFDIRLGAAYNNTFRIGCLPCLRLSLEVGYEFIDIIKGVDRTYYVDDRSVGQSLVTYMDLALHGPYFRAAIGF